MQSEFSPSENALFSIDGVSGRVSPSDFSLHPNTDSASDNETSERPVREKLKKASIASVPKDCSLYSATGIGADEDNNFRHVGSSIIPEHTSSPAKRYEASVNGCHARAERNRSYDDLLRSGKHEIYAGDTEAEINHVPTPKQSEEFHISDSEVKSRLKATREVENSGYDESSPDFDAATNASRSHFTKLGSSKSPLSQRDSDDLEMGFALFGPRKKRSRDQLDADIDREQKIVATEEAKAQRRSEEQERDTPETAAVTDAETQRYIGSITSQSEERGLKSFDDSNTLRVVIFFLMSRLLTYSIAGPPLE